MRPLSVDRIQIGLGTAVTDDIAGTDTDDVAGVDTDDVWW